MLNGRGVGLILDKMYNGKYVIDQIADYNINEMFQSRKPLVICMEIWEGPYEKESFLNHSLAFRVILNIFFKKKNLAGYSPNFKHELAKMTV
jgi:hypothetical protein